MAFSVMGGKGRCYLHAERSALERERDAKRKRARERTRAWFRGLREDAARKHRERVARIRAQQDAAERLASTATKQGGVFARLRNVVRKMVGR